MDSGAPGSGKNVRLVELEAEARYARDRYRLYRAQAYGPRSTSPRRLHVLERASQLADGRLDRAKAEQGRSGNGRLSGSLTLPVDSAELHELALSVEREFARACGIEAWEPDL